MIFFFAKFMADGVRTCCLTTLLIERKVSLFHASYIVHFRHSFAERKVQFFAVCRSNPEPLFGCTYIKLGWMVMVQMMELPGYSRHLIFNFFLQFIC